MNKQTMYVIFAFILGVLVTQLLLDEKTVEKSEVAVADQQNSQRKQNSNAKINKIKKATRDTIEIANAPNREVTPAAQVVKVEPEKINSKKIVNLTLDEAVIGQLEHNINELSAKVVMRQEPRGWRVEYVHADNLLANAGLNNNDLVLYDLIDSARRDPATESLINRLENIFEALKR